jgi:outer membrane protein insertion porin family
VFNRAEWTASLGLRYQRVQITDSDGNVEPRDVFGNLLSASDSGEDDLLTLQFGAVRDRRNDSLRPTRGSFLRLGIEQSAPIGSGSIFLTRLRGNYSYYVPTRLLRLSPGCRKEKPTATDCPQAFAFNVQLGTIFGDLPPYEAFALGGTNSVRGYDEGELGTGRSFFQATAEYRFPLFSIVSGALFADFGSDLGTGDNVPGNPAGIRNKPGTGFGYGIGARIQSPIGPIRLDFGINDEGDNQIHFGVGERF